MDENLHPLAREGIRLFNAGAFFEAHEALEKAWLESPAPIRNLYRGLLQAAVVCLHLERGNLRGALKVYRRSLKWLEPWPEVVAGIAVGRLRREMAACIQAARTSGTAAFSKADCPRIRLHFGDIPS